MRCRQATEEDHGELLELSRSFPHTRAFSHFMFSGPEAYAKGWIRVLVHRGRIVGFTCVRHKVRAPETSLYYIVVDSKHQNQGLGELLLDDMYLESPHTRFVLNVEKNNAQARRFYEKHGWWEEGEALKGKGIKLAKEL